MNPLLRRSRSVSINIAFQEFAFFTTCNFYITEEQLLRIVQAFKKLEIDVRANRSDMRFSILFHLSSILTLKNKVSYHLYQCKRH